MTSSLAGCCPVSARMTPVTQGKASALPQLIHTIARAGEVAEWSNVPDSKSGVGANPPWVRIPPSPPDDQ